ncbi:LTA synthase family protein [Pedobacter deserti]|uniref:LTA synthase family protein n=1 Tax=Pedobacter deserti TaxID=2817382 RepID=UPI00210C3F11|nr:LTA synthase family protein [Pedobacter sp. SYSU D00382]
MIRIKAASHLFIKLSLVWLMAVLCIGLFEIVLNGLTHEFPAGWPAMVLWSWLAGFLFWLKWQVAAYILFVLLYFAKPGLAKLVFSVFIVLITITHLLLIQYFNVSLVPLGADLFGYSLADIRQTVGASGGIGFLPLIFLLFFIAAIALSLRYIPRKLQVPFWLAVAFPVLSLLLHLTSAYASWKGPRYTSDFNNNLVTNKADYFFSDSYDHFFPGDDDVDIYADAYIGDYITAAPGNVAFKYADEEKYPFLHQEVSRDVLGPFFQPGKQRPNIVIILVEGLGRAFTNEGAYLGNFTPFLDSLAGKSLYWKNFLSQGGRTFAVLPSIMASLPFARNGFLELGNDMPEHLSLYNILKKAGYHTAFYYGGDAAFDNMNIFLKKNDVDQVNDAKSFPAGYRKMPAVNGFTWGYSDKELFRHYFSKTAAVPSLTPQLNVILTVATHNPFIINEQARYTAVFEKRMSDLGFDESKKDTYRHYALQYSTIMYADQALKEFFEQYKRRADYQQTIFVVTGDHRMPEIPMSSKIDRYHVPLLIYSPLLKRTAAFNSVSTHFDIAPSLFSFLEQNYQLPAPALSSWMGLGLDTARAFRNIHAYPLMQTKTEIVDFIMDEYHLNGSQLYKLSPNMSEEAVEDEQKKSQLKRAFDRFKQRNSKLSNGSPLLPDSIYKRFAPQ